MNFGPAAPIPNTVSPTDLTTPGYIAVDHSDHTVYVSHQNSGALYVSRSTDRGLTWTTVLVDDKTGHGHLFDPIKVGTDGTVYTVWSNERHILYSYSSDHGATWSTPGLVDDPAATLSNVFPWLEAGSAGRIDVVWFGSASQNVSAAEWDVCFSQSLNANSAAPVFRQQVITDHRVHGSNISEGGLTGAANRNLGDYFQIAYDPQGAAVVAFADDHNDFDGNTFVTRQLSGTGLLESASDGTGEVQGTLPSPLPLRDLALPQVTDPVHDAAISAQPIPTDNPFDIVSIRYDCDQNGPNAPYLVARMKLSGLTAMPAGGNWRMAFTANAPWAVDLRPDGVSDHGDMFFMMASDSAGTPSFTYGTAYRDSNPLVPVVFAAYAMAYTFVGVADSGSIDTTTGTVTVKVALSRFNALLPPTRPAIAQGSWLCGLRGSAASSGSGPRDNTRGGQDNLYVSTGLTSVDDAPAALRLAVRAWPNPARAGSELRYALPASGDATLDIFDLQGRRVRSLLRGRASAGEHSLRWNGSGPDGRVVAGGIYFARLQLEGHVVTTRIVFMK